MPRRREGRDLPEVVLSVFEQARSHFPDPRAVNRTLVELSRLFDAVSGGPILDHGARRRIIELLREGRTEEAAQALTARFDEYRETFKAVENAPSREPTPIV